MTAQTIIGSLIGRRWLSSFVVPNYTPRNWLECDVFEISKAGYVTEYEVKMTVADFKADAMKERRDYSAKRIRFDAPDEDGNLFAPHAMLNKHDLLEVGDVRGPSRFFFVAPEGLLMLEELPTWAGLIEIYGKHSWEKVAKAAPKLHREKVDAKIRAHAESVCYFRMHRLLGDARQRERIAAKAECV